MPDAQLTETEGQQLHTLAGQLNWTSLQSRPNISYQTCEVRPSIKNATISSFYPSTFVYSRISAKTQFLDCLLSSVAPWGGPMLDIKGKFFTI